MSPNTFPMNTDSSNSQPTINNSLLASYGSGSYLASDVTVLLDIVDKDTIADMPVSQKEALIQSGQRHYSDMLTLEHAPSAMHEQLYIQALDQGTQRTATDIANLAHTFTTKHPLWYQHYSRSRFRSTGIANDFKSLSRQSNCICRWLDG